MQSESSVLHAVKLLFYTGNFLFYMTSRSYLMTILTNNKVVFRTVVNFFNNISRDEKYLVIRIRHL